MTDKIRIYHNPRCSKSRQTLELLQNKHLQPEVIEYLGTPPNATELESLLRMLGLQPRQLMRTKEAEYKMLGLDNPKLTDKQLIKAMVEHPKLIERPIVVAHGKAAIGRPPEAVLEIL
ncbi:MAG TPA: arsenate reductase (glutaredoxin) [Gammaproteobacteria bacterium]|jgi:arsenate reductase (glutaredoxin)|nr:arsenate reductase (glutaredoxin) [Gammaproteobacteria bacterium]